MRKIISEFARRGLVASGFGPLFLAVLYLILQNKGVVQTLSAQEVSIGIFSLWVLAFIAGGMNVLYQIEKLPLMAAVFLHGMILYGAYLLTYLINGWLNWRRMPIVAFTCIFFLGYMAVWAVIYILTKRNTAKVNAMLKKKQQRKI